MGSAPGFTRMWPEVSCPGHPASTGALATAERLGRRAADVLAARAALNEDSFALQLFNSAAPDWALRFQDVPEELLRLAMASEGPAAGQQLSTTAPAGLLETLLNLLHLPYSLLEEPDRQTLLEAFARALPVKAGEAGVLLQVRRPRTGPPELQERQLPALCEYLGITMVLHDEAAAGGAHEDSFRTLAYAPHCPVVVVCRQQRRYRALVPLDQAAPGAGVFTWSRHRALLSRLVSVPLPESMDLRLLSAEQAREVADALGLGDKVRDGADGARLRKPELLERLKQARPTLDALSQAQRRLEGT